MLAHKSQINTRYSFISRCFALSFFLTNVIFILRSSSFNVFLLPFNSIYHFTLLLIWAHCLFDPFCLTLSQNPLLYMHLFKSSLISLQMWISGLKSGVLIILFQHVITYDHWLDCLWTSVAQRCYYCSMQPHCFPFSVNFILIMMTWEIIKSGIKMIWNVIFFFFNVSLIYSNQIILIILYETDSMKMVLRARMWG